MKHLFYIIMCAATFSCNSSHVGKYVYIETWRNGFRLHIDRHCSNFNKNSEVAYIDTCDLQNSQSFCSKCVSDIDAFLKFQNSQVRYVFVLRCGAKELDKNIFFVMTYRDLDIAIKNGAVKQSDTCVSVKIKFSEKTSEPFLYDQKESSAQYFLNNFNL